jgi:hypothetical protein
LVKEPYKGDSQNIRMNPNFIEHQTVDVSFLSRDEIRMIESLVWVLRLQQLGREAEDLWYDWP